MGHANFAISINGVEVREPQFDQSTVNLCNER